MSRFLSLLVLGFATCLASTASAGAFSGILGRTFLEDDDWESQVRDNLGDGKLNDGDLLLAVLQFNFTYQLTGEENFDLDGSITDDGTPEKSFSTSTDAITAISLIEVDGDPNVISGIVAEYKFKGASSADWATFTGLAGVADNTGAILFDNPPATPRIDISSIPSAIASVVSGSEIAQFQVVEWFAQSISVLGDPTNPLDILTLDFVASLNTDDPRFGEHNMLGDPDLATPYALENLQSVGPVDLQLQGVLGTGPKGEFQLRTDTDVYINIVPEPTSFAIFAVMGLAGVSARRRRKA